MKSFSCLISLLCISFLSVSVNAQVPKGTISNGMFNNFHEHYDGGFIVAGNSPALYYLNYGLITKTDINGKMLWKRFVGEASYLTSFSKVWPTLDGGFVAAGESYLFDSINYPLFVKFNACGNVEWSRKILISTNGYWTNIVQFNDGSYVGMFTEGEDMYYGTGHTILLNLDSYGAVTEIDTLTCNQNSGNNIQGFDMMVFPDNHLLIPSAQDGCGGSPILIKTDKHSAVDWSTYYSGVGEAAVYNSDFAGDGSIYSTADRLGAPNDNHAITFKFKDGNQLWYKTMFPDSMTAEGPVCVVNNETYIGAFHVLPSQAGNYSHYLAVYDSSGSMLSRQYDGYEVRELRKTSDNKIMALGNFWSAQTPDKILGKYRMNPQLDTIFLDSIYTNSIAYDYLCQSAITTDTIELDPEIITGITELPSKKDTNGRVDVFPNPAHDQVTIQIHQTLNESFQIAIYNSSGSIVMKRTPDQQISTIDISGLPRGLLLLQVLTDNNVVTSLKFIKQ